MGEETISELIAQLPEEIQAMVNEYLPVLGNMAIDEIKMWINMSISGQTAAAYRLLLVKMDNEAILQELDQLVATTDVQNDANAAAIEKQKQIATDVCLGVLTVAVGYLAKYVPLSSLGTTQGESST